MNTIRKIENPAINFSNLIEGQKITLNFQWEGRKAPNGTVICKVINTKERLFQLSNGNNLEIYCEGKQFFARIH